MRLNNALFERNFEFGSALVAQVLVWAPDAFTIPISYLFVKRTGKGGGVLRASTSEFGAYIGPFGPVVP